MAARLPIPGGDEGQWGEILNQYLSVEHNADGTQKALTVGKGGTGAVNAAAARFNLGIASRIPIYIQHAKPPSRAPHLWVQTGLGTSGQDMTFWVEDGK